MVTEECSGRQLASNSRTRQRLGFPREEEAQLDSAGPGGVSRGQSGGTRLGMTHPSWLMAGGAACQPGPKSRGLEGERRHSGEQTLCSDGSRGNTPWS